MSTCQDVLQVSERLGISVQRVRTLCRSGALEARKFGRSWAIDPDSVQSYGLKTSHTIAEDHPAHAAPRKQGERPIALSFFSGAMGLDIGLEKAGFDVKLACESDKYCRQTIALNRPDMALLGDVNALDAYEVRRHAGLSADEEIDLVAGGPPCQAFSTAGHRKGFHDERGNVFLKYIDLALELKPKFIVIENVRGLLSCPMSHRPHDKRGPGFPDLAEDELRGGALNFILNRLNASDYAYSFNLYNAANFGTPQTRERVVIICSRDGKEPPFIPPTHSQDGDFGLPRWKTVKSCIADIPEHHHLNFPDKRIRYYKLLGPGENWRNLPVELQREALGKSFDAGGGKTGFLRRLSWDKPSPTLVTHPTMPATDLAHPIECRPLSIEEYKRIQQFPDTWDIAGPLIQQYKQIGNAVPTGLGLAIGSLIRTLLKGEAVPNTTGFRYSRYRHTSHAEWQIAFRKQAESRKATAKQGSLSLA